MSRINLSIEIHDKQVIKVINEAKSRKSLTKLVNALFQGYVYNDFIRSTVDGAEAASRQELFRKVSNTLDSMQMDIADIDIISNEAENIVSHGATRMEDAARQVFEDGFSASTAPSQGDSQLQQEVESLKQNQSEIKSLLSQVLTKLGLADEKSLETEVFVIPEEESPLDEEEYSVVDTSSVVSKIVLPDKDIVVSEPALPRSNSVVSETVSLNTNPVVSEIVTGNEEVENTEDEITATELPMVENNTLSNNKSSSLKGIKSRLSSFRSKNVVKV